LKIESWKLNCRRIDNLDIKINLEQALRIKNTKIGKKYLLKTLKNAKIGE
jgi:hypothetical protein